ncbi:MAG: hypothetical protein JSW34_03145 [Candidatus Zixiibacteriota bacterium]|nr:MAG: hypothetical protein JSW34_03145 [candidate division Zixibacteria bacterium]
MRALIIFTLLSLCLVSLAVAGERKCDVGKTIIYDMPAEEQIARYGKLAGQDLTPEDLAMIAADNFTGDTLRLLAILVEWDDRPGTWDREVFDSMLFSRDVYPGGSLADYIYEVSYGQVTMTGDVIDWVNGGEYDPHFPFSTLLEPLDSIIDYSLYDGDNNNKVDAVCFLRSGNGQELTHDTTDIWSFANIETHWCCGPFDGVKVTRWHSCPETRPMQDSLDPRELSGEDTLINIRVFAHELVHNLGLHDLYDYDNKLDTSTFTEQDANDHPLYDWCIMGYHGYHLLSYGSHIPSHPCGWSKCQLGWIEPLTIDDGFEGTIAIRDIETNADSSLYKIPVGQSGDEYYLLEYRNPNSSGTFDKFDSDFSCYFHPYLAIGGDLMDRGLLITHIDDSLCADGQWTCSNNGTPGKPHYVVAVEDAGYNPNRDASSNPGGHVTDSAQWWYPYECKKGALFSHDVEGQSEFSATTTPSSVPYSAYSPVYVRVDSIVGDRLYAYVSTQYCCEVPGDADHSGQFDILDLDFLIGYLYRNGEPPTCYEEADPNGDGIISILDLDYLSDFLYRGGPAPVPCPEW